VTDAEKAMLERAEEQTGALDAGSDGLPDGAQHLGVRGLAEANSRVRVVD
jgi:hypothetical protein